MKELLRLISHKKFKALFAAKTHNSYVQFFRYVLVGAVSSIADWSALYACYDLINMNYYLSIALAFLLGLILNYVLSKKFVFTGVTVSDRPVGQFYIYFVTGVIGLILTEIFMVVFDRYLCLHYMAAKIISTILVFVWNFGSKKIILYRKRDDK